MKIKCFLLGHAHHSFQSARDIVDELGMRIGLVTSLTCDRCGHRRDVVTWSAGFGPVPRSKKAEK